MGISDTAATGKEIIDATQSAVINAAANVGEIIENTKHVASGHEGPFYLAPEFWVGMAFLVVIFLLFKPIISVAGDLIQKRIEKIRTRIDESSALLNDAQRLLADYERKYHNAKKEAKIILDKSQKNIAYIKSESLRKLEQDMQSKEKDAHDRINSSKENLDQELTDLTTLYTMQTVRQAIMDNLSTKTQDKLIDNSIAALKNIKLS